MSRNFLKKIPLLKILLVKYRLSKYRRFEIFVKIHLYNFISYFYHSAEVTRIRNKTSSGKQVNVIFLVSDKSVWKTDLVFQNMEKDSRYNPCIVVIPRINAIDMLENAKDTYDFFKKKGYQSKITYSNDNWQRLDIIDDIDIIFFSNPHAISLPQYLISSLYKKLTCYVPYFEQIDTDYETHFNGLTENLCWKVFQINDIHKDIAFKHAFNRGRNIHVVGYPATESLYNEDEIKRNPWKIDLPKKIIIAPHHSIVSTMPWASSTFLETAETLKSLSSLFSNSVCFAFKPHPLLKGKLYNHPNWGVKKTEQYWDFWRSQKNTQFEDGGYIDLFKTSDAMIHDCSSFIIEYLYVEKPCLYLNPNIRDGLNEYGKFGYDAITKSKQNEDIIKFVESVVNETATSLGSISDFNLIPKESPTKKIMSILNSELSGGK